MNFGQAARQVLHQLSATDPHQARNAFDPIRRFGNLVGLRIVDHLNAMLDLAMRPVVIGQLVSNVLWHPAF